MSKEALNMSKEEALNPEKLGGGLKTLKIFEFKECALNVSKEALNMSKEALNTSNQALNSSNEARHTSKKALNMRSEALNMSNAALYMLEGIQMKERRGGETLVAGAIRESVGGGWTETLAAER